MEDKFAKDNIALLDIFDLKFLQDFQDAFAKSVNIASLMVDDNGPITQPSNFTDFCMKCTRGSELGRKRCNECDLNGGEIASKQKKPVIYTCHSGLTDFAVPIVLNGKHIASILGGQILTTKPDEEKFREIARELNIDENYYIEELRKIKIISKEQLQTTAELLFFVANAISELANKNLELKKKATSENVLRKIISSSVNNFNTKEIINSLVTETCQLFGADRCLFIEYDPNSSDMSLRSYSEYLSSPNIVPASTNVPEKIVIDAIVDLLKEKEIQISNDVANDKLLKESKNVLIDKLSVKSYLVAPVYYGDVNYGAIVLHYVKDYKKFDNEEIDLIKAIANQSAAIIHQAKLYSTIKKNEKFTKTILNSIQDGIITLDDNFIIEECNPSVEKIWGYKPTDCIGKPLNFLLKSHDKTSDYLCLDPKSIYGTRKNGEEFPIEMNLSNVITEDKKVILLTVRDITERQRIEQMKNEFVSTVSHELRTPLTSIRGALGLITSGKMGELSDKIKGLLDIANNNCLRLINLINDILDIEKIEAGKMSFEVKTVELMPIIEHSIQSNIQFAQRFGVEIKLTQGLGKVFVMADGNRLIQVITNLLSNAIKFSEQKMPVEVAVTKMSDENGIRVAITNYGTEIQPEFKNRIFQKFAQADSSDARQKGGTGLGLSISKAIIEKMNGRIGFSSENKKTTFYFDLQEILVHNEGKMNEQTRIDM